jgi:hypothetical protein
MFQCNIWGQKDLDWTNGKIRYWRLVLPSLDKAMNLIADKHIQRRLRM